MENFITCYFSDKYIESFKRIINGALKADLFLFCVMYIYSGFYVDVDMECIIPIDQVVSSYTTLVTATDFGSV
jgi:mannosyltransferase OCH1-like enzyme